MPDNVESSFVSPANHPDIDRDVLANLNEAQRAAVTHETGPLLVVAGAGTGKTNVLTRRIAWLIETKRAKADEVLALTFTEKAAQEMQERTDILLPMGVTDTWIHTFHSFGRRILEEEAILAGLPPDFTVMNESEQQVFLGDRLPTLTNLTALRPLGNPFKFVAPIVKLISRAKDELVSPADYTAYAQRLTDAATEEGEQQTANLQRELALIYQHYEQWKDEAHAVDYGDLIAKLMQLARANPSLRQRLAQRFKYILVDEFQDTNVAQYELVRLLVGETKNLTVVGDDDQAIYKFRGAAVSNILGFLEDFPNAEQVILTENYRSTQPILDAAYQMIQSNNPDRLEAKLSISKRLTSQTTAPTPAVEFEHFATESDELRWIVNAVKTADQSGVALNNIAVLARAHAQLDDVARVLTIAGIPVQTPNDRTFIHRPEIRGLVAFLKVLAHPTDSLSLLKLALSPYYQANPEWLLHMNDAVRARNQSFHEVLKDEERPPWGVLPEDGRVMMRRLRDELARYRTEISNRTVWEILYQFLHDHGALASETPEDQLRVANLAVLFRAIKSYSQAGRDPHTLAFVSYLDQLVGTLESPTNDVGPNESAVNLLTVHAAKGLEFDTVIVPSLIQGRFPGINRHDLLELPTELIKERLPEGNEHLEEERRLFYVAMTRAKRKLLLSAAERYGGGRPRKVSPFVMEALGNVETTAQIYQGENFQALVEFAPLTHDAKPLRYPETNGVITLSPAKIESYLKCPNEFYWRYVLNAPQVATPVLTYGNAVHASIETFDRLRQQGETNIDTLTAAAIERFHQGWTDEGFVSMEQSREMLVRGEATLQRFIAQNIINKVPTMVEHWIHLTLNPGIAIRGRIDALWVDGEIEIRDYKTSEGVTTEKKALERAKENVPLRIYGYAIREETGRMPNRLVLDFVESNVLGVIEPKDGVIDDVADVVRDVVEGIRAGKFDPNPGQHFCDVCGKM